jgi:hypothetical protein
MSGTVITAHEFLNALIPEGFINCRAVDCTKQKPTINGFFPAGDHTPIQQFIRKYGDDREIYFAVVSRFIRDGSTKGCGNAFAIFGDIDFKDSSETEARSRLAAFPLRPSIVVWSGGGLHVYWLLQTPYDLRNGSAGLFKSVLRRTGIALKADVVCSEPAHILRIPGTLNHKYPDARTVTVEVWELDRRYTLDDFDFLPPEPEPKAKTNGYSGSSAVLYLSDDEILSKFRKAANAAKFSRLFDRGDITGYPSQSEADFALCCMLTFYTDDESQIDRLFRASALYREDKWGKRPQYRQQTITRAIDRTTERYDPNRNGRETWNAATTATDHVDDADVDESPVDDSEPIPDPDGFTEDEAPRPTKYSDDALADLFSSRHELDFLYVDSWGWLRWTGQRWQRVADVAVMGYARQVCPAIRVLQGG